MTGGVCAHLDYDVDLMAEYVAEMASRLAMGSPRSSESFQKFISQILSSTRLPRTTILLGMNYFAKRINRMAMMNTGAKLSISEGYVWRLLTVALLLGSKFLDDNTFQNRSWADVSGIPVSELNKLEREWMEAIGWGLYVNLDLSEDYTAWIKSWHDWEATRKHRQVLSHDRLNSIGVAMDNDIAITRTALVCSSWHQQQIAEYERLSRMKRNERSMQKSYCSRDFSWTYQPHSDPWSSAPLTPPDSGYGTPDYINSAASVSTPYNDLFNQQAQQTASRAFASVNYNGQQYGATANPTSYHRNLSAKVPAYNFYGHSIWENNFDSSFNNASNCYHSKQNAYFGNAHPYGQPVMG